MQGQQRFESVWLNPVRPTSEFHLQNAQVNADLQLGPAVGPRDGANVDATWLVWPVIQELREITVVIHNWGTWQDCAIAAGEQTARRVTGRDKEASNWTREALKPHRNPVELTTGAEPVFCRKVSIT